MLNFVKTLVKGHALHLSASKSLPFEDKFDYIHKVFNLKVWLLLQNHSKSPIISWIIGENGTTTIVHPLKLKYNFKIAPQFIEKSLNTTNINRLLLILVSSISMESLNHIPTWWQWDYHKSSPFQIKMKFQNRFTIDGEIGEHTIHKYIQSRTYNLLFLRSR